MTFETKQQWHVVLDPGHGGSESGFTAEGAEEKTINLAVCLRLQALLEAYGVDVLLTRTADTDVSAVRRAELAAAMEADLFVSWHCDYLEDAEVSGVSLWIGETADESRMIDFEALGEAIVDVTGQIMLGVFQDSDKVLSLVQTPALMIRGAFLSSPHELELCKNPDFLQAQAQGAARGILKVLPRLSPIS
ncbi:N-acetylmuramoyl-L-alanine amidase [Tumebacillus sp. BK434]|uniref:N-acetylmuramoyl-L-alanine amidase family protein n=1 Tax=Tumebacillus sp. BK434 TaxID=2512169 RepID=UPI00104AC3E1|nr:N-acetylmuramoyl-L-alanine amidase [Tumebacillus sp. BK434]TCP53807.1 N-acetylmuramoyl-L-alanine amidase [Tumebacillus sp. BK434]